VTDDGDAYTETVDDIREIIYGRQAPWHHIARCVTLGLEPSFFFPPQGVPAGAAKAICVQCEVRATCLEYAMAHGDKFGIWGGMSARDRKRLTRVRRLQRQLIPTRVRGTSAG
jgi:WhiB family redox-sensing transcriptional regulator